ncbi:MAG: VTT domain-containing protein [Marinobacter sp.]|nr:VTT domain-containing protein [Marinobacter sp.]
MGFALGRYFGPKDSTFGIGQAHRRSALGASGTLSWPSWRYRGLSFHGFLPVLHSLIPVTVGMSAMRYRTFMAWTVPATTIWSIGYVSVGALAAGSFRELLDQLHYAGYVFVAIVVGFVVLALIAKKLLQRSQRRHMEHRDSDHE